jgi:rubredoxin-NAD+ reductase
MLPTPPANADGKWDIEQDGNSVVATYRAADGQLLGFALTGEGTKQKMPLQKELPPLMA